MGDRQKEPSYGSGFADFGEKLCNLSCAQGSQDLRPASGELACQYGGGGLMWPGPGSQYPQR